MASARLFVVCMLLAIPVTAEGWPVDARGGIDDPAPEIGSESDGLDPEALVRRTYRLLATRITASGTPIELHVSGVRILPRAEFAGVKIGEIFTFDPDEWVQIVLRSEVEEGRVVRTSFPAAWDSGPPLNSDRDRILGMSLLEGLELGQRHGGGPIPEAIAVFEVHLTLAGKSRDYRAYFLLPGYRDGQPVGEFIPRDQVLRPPPEMFVGQSLLPEREATGSLPR